MRMAHKRPIPLLISILFLAIVITRDTCANVQENNNELLKDALEMIYRRQNSIENNPQTDETVFLKSQSHNYGGIPYLDVNEEQQRNDPIDFEQYRHMMDSSSATDDEITLPYEVFYNDNSSPTADDMEMTSKPSKRKHSVFRERTNDGEIIYPKYNEVPIQNNDNLENELDYMNLLQEYWQRYLAERQQQHNHRVQQYEDTSVPSKRNNRLRLPYSMHSDNIVMKKRFPVAKRSSNIRSKKTDPKVERDLSNIFGGGSSSSTIKPVDESKKLKTPKKVIISNNNKKNQTKTKTDNLNIKKKSIDWSNYFGIDKRKKKSTTPQNEWIIEQYKNTLKQINHLNDETTHEQQKQRRDDTKLDVIKDKLRNIEDMIIDEALKYTGAHEGVDIDSKEIQEVKDKVMSRLAAVYSLEKMRRALGEFKKSIAEQRKQLKANQLNGDFELLDTDDTDSNTENHDNDSTTSASSANNEHVNRIPNKKDALLHSNQNKDNNILNQQSDEHIEDCDILEVIQRQCSHLATKAGEQLVQPLCMLHQLCTLCGIDESNDSQQNIIENSDLGCYYMYAAESEQACAGETQCRRRANYALNALRDVHTRPIFTADMCPHNTVCIENVLETAKRRLSFSPYIMSRRNI